MSFVKDDSVSKCMGKDGGCSCEVNDCNEGCTFQMYGCEWRLTVDGMCCANSVNIKPLLAFMAKDSELRALLEEALKG